MPTPDIFTSVINSYLPEPHASLLNGIIFGTSLKTSKVFYEELKRVGLLHIVVLSGMNITILAAIVSTLTGFLNKKISLFLTIGIIIIFILFVGAKPPIIRAGFMGILTLLTILYGKRSLVLYSLFLSALLIFIFWPEWIKTISFQLSYGATLGITLWGQTKPTTKSQLWKELKTSLAAQVFTVPIIFFYFKEVSFIAPLSNLLIAGIVPPLMIFGFLTAFLGKIHFVLGLLPSYVSYLLLSYVILIVKILASIPFAFYKF